MAVGLGLPRNMMSSPIVADPVALALAPSAPLMSAEPFVWGEGGSRMTPEQVAQLRAMGQSRTSTDFSPVGHWTQGLGRVVDNVMGAYDLKRAGEADEANAAADAEIAEMLANGGGDNAALARVMMDRNAGAGVRDFAGMEYARRNAPVKERAPTETEKLLMASGVEPGSPEWNAQIQAELLNRRDPFTTFQGPGIGYTGRQSGLVAALGGGGQSSGVPQTTAPPAEAIAALKRGEGTPEQFDEMFGQGAAARVLGGPTQPASGGFPGG